ncbi:SDR family oxidoreductase [Nostocoides sp. F2B08]|uniref:SDR family NAD(P)-dependent oxidoreductase n=1 Tax=Nostocoides sp. F2B08 TaxID=2653936 RepID=UPI00186ADF8B|nr:SDR family NAD(P)-dependent oxidoreductase [Tetrasphaera sp. F2B08]
MDLRGAHVLLTGATGEVGRALAHSLAGRGARLTLVARSKPDLTALTFETGGRALPADLLDADQRSHLVERAEELNGPLDVLVNNAGVETSQHVADEDAGSVERAVTLNLHAPIDLCRTALESMLSRDRGTIVNVSSLSAVSSVPGMATYAATKAGLSHFTSGLQADLRGTGVRTLLVELGPIRSPMIERARAYPPTDAAFARLFRTRLLSIITAGRAAEAVCDALERDRRHLRLPRRAIPYALLTQAPRELAAVALTGVPHAMTRAGIR